MSEEKEVEVIVIDRKVEEERERLTAEMVERENQAAMEVRQEEE
jgi:hypothetical protein